MDKRDVKPMPLQQQQQQQQQRHEPPAPSTSSSYLSDTTHLAAYSTSTHATVQTSRMQSHPQDQLAPSSQHNQQLPYYAHTPDGAQNATPLPSASIVSQQSQQQQHHHHQQLPPPQPQSQIPQQQQQQPQDYRVPPNGMPPVSLPPIQHFKSTQDDMPPQQPPVQYAHMNGDHMMQAQQQQQPPQPIMPYPYQNGMMPAMMPGNAQMMYPRGGDVYQDRRYTPPMHPLPPYGMGISDARQMSGGRHKKEIKRRTKTGCLTCRKRRIKCDEGTPSCRNCEKSKRECMGYDPVFRPQTGPAAIQPALSAQMPGGPNAGKMQYMPHLPYGQSDGVDSGDRRRQQWITMDRGSRNYPGMVPVQLVDTKPVLNDGEAQQAESANMTDPQLQQA